MVSISRTFKRTVAVGAAASLSLVALAGCAQTSEEKAESQSGGAASADSGSVVLIGTTDSIVSLDPAGSYDNGSFAVQTQLFPFLMSAPYGSPDVEPDLAESADFTGPTEYTVKLRDDAKWSDGSPITSEDVKFSFDRVVSINDENGPSSLLWNLVDIDTPDESTVVFNLDQENDQTFPQVLSSPAGVIVPADIFDADGLTPDDTILNGKFGGEYVLTAFDKNSSATYAANPEYNGLYGQPRNGAVEVTYYTEASNMKLDVQQGNIDVAYRSLSSTDIEDLEKQDSVNVWKGPGGEIRYIVFNFDTQPFGAATDQADEAKALAVRQAIADIIDREAISTNVYKGTYTPLYSWVSSGMTGATEDLKEAYGDGNGGPDVERAKERLEAAGVTEPVELHLQYSPDHYGPSSGDEYALIKDQLEATGLFTVDLKGTEWTQYSKDRVNDAYPAYQLGWFPDYSDADNYLTPFFLVDPDGNTGFIMNHYSNDEVNRLIPAQGSEPDSAKRTEMIEQIQGVLAEGLPTLPFLEGAQVAVAGTKVTDLVLDPSFKFHYGSIEME